MFFLSDEQMKLIYSQNVYFNLIRLCKSLDTISTFFLMYYLLYGNFMTNFGKESIYKAIVLFLVSKAIRKIILSTNQAYLKTLEELKSNHTH